MSYIHVTCAIIERNGLVLAARRSASMHLPLKWEFPGGKIRAGEDPGECLKREIREELDLEKWGGITYGLQHALFPATLKAWFEFL